MYITRCITTKLATRRCRRQLAFFFGKLRFFEQQQSLQLDAYTVMYGILRPNTHFPDPIKTPTAFKNTSVFGLCLSVGGVFEVDFGSFSENLQV